MRHKWVAWGGSYPGMLAAWSRAFSPHLFHAAVASSAPLHAVADFRGYNDVVGASLELRSVGGGGDCSAAVRDAFADVGQRLRTAVGRRYLERAFPICGVAADELPGGPLDDPYAQRALAEDLTYFFPAQSNDPACDAPGCNIARACATMRDTSLGAPILRLEALVAAVSTSSSCVGPGYAAAAAALTDTTLEGGGARVWLWQTCTAFGFYQTCDPDSACPFVTNPWLSNLSASLADCALAFGDEGQSVHAAVADTNEAFGGLTPAASRILFVNGEVDPWRAASVASPPGAGTEVLWVPGASHHAWTHPPRPSDSPAVVASRAYIDAHVTAWLHEPLIAPADAPPVPPPACAWSAASVINVLAAVVSGAVAGGMAVLALQSYRARGGLTDVAGADASFYLPLLPDNVAVNFDATAD